MQTYINNLPKGTQFTYDGKEWIITDDSYPFPTAKCISEHQEYDTMFWKNEEVETNAKQIYEYKFVQTRKNCFQQVRVLTDSPF